jgi:hypothetical protein
MLVILHHFKIYRKRVVFSAYPTPETKGSYFATFWVSLHAVLLPVFQ